MTSYVVQTWKGTERIHDDIGGLSLDAVGRIMAEQGDYTEVYDPKRGVRRGTHAETTLVMVPSKRPKAISKPGQKGLAMWKPGSLL